MCPEDWKGGSMGGTKEGCIGNLKKKAYETLGWTVRDQKIFE
jgi:hypothetical protein